MAQEYKIVTHPGMAHRDDFLSCAVICDNVNVVSIERRDPTPEDIGDEFTFVVDCGGVLDFSYNNLDHHHDIALDCSFNQTLKRFELEEAFKEVYPWVDFTNSLDISGPFKTAENLGVPVDSFFKMMSPVEKFMLDEFAKNPMWALPFLRTMGHSLCRDAMKFINRKELLETSVQVLDANGIKYLFHDIEDQPQLAMDWYRKTFEADAVVSVIPDDRGDGWTLFRFNDDPRIDFMAIEGFIEVLFAHKGGFIAKTHERVGQDVIKELIEKSTKAYNYGAHL